MERRDFLHATLAATCAVSAAGAAEEAKPAARELYEWRIYTLKAAKQPIIDAYLSKALIPTLKRLNAGPVGTFVEKIDSGVHLHVLIVHPSGESFATLSGRLAADADYVKLAGEYWTGLASDPPYTRIETSLLVAIDGMPKLDRPDASKPRLLNLRIYESHNERANKKKIEMFNKGELAIFRRTGLTPVLFGEAIAGTNIPNLTYLLVFPDEAGRKAAWDKFRDDDEWKKLKAMPEYADKEIVSRITNKILTPTAYSEI
jgi:NIPSNAP protein